MRKINLKTDKPQDDWRKYGMHDQNKYTFTPIIRLSGPDEWIPIANLVPLFFV